MRSNLFSRIVIACAGAMATLFLAATAAAATPSPAHGGAVRATASPSAILHPGQLRAPGSTLPQSMYLGGFDVTPSEGLGSISATFKVPNGSCADSNDYEDIFLGSELLDPASGNYLGDAASDIIFACAASTTPDYSIEAFNRASDEDPTTSVSPGDIIETRIAELGNGQTVASTIDLTNGASVVASGPTNTTDTDYYAGAVPNLSYEGDGPTVDYYVPVFKTVTFAASQVNGLLFNQISPAPAPYALNDTGGSEPQIVPAKLSSSPSARWEIGEVTPY